MTQTAGQGDPARKKMQRARTALLLDEPWFGSLALRLQLVEDPGVETAGVDGTSLFYAPAWVLSLTDAELRGVVAHEVLHCAMLHPFRKNGRNHDKWNIACDHAINLLLSAKGFILPKDRIEDQQYANLAAETIYARLPDGRPACGWGLVLDAPAAPPAQQTPRSGQGTPQPAKPPPASGQASSASQSPPLTASDWQIAAEQASMVAKKAGKLPGNVDRAVRAARDSATDWRAILREFVQRVFPTDYSWARPNRRYMGTDLYVPGIVREGMQRLGGAMDTSGSCQSFLGEFVAEFQQLIREVRPDGFDLVYCDDRVQRVVHFEPDEEVEFKTMGGGGTAFQPALDWFSAQDEPPAAVIYLTDLYGDNDVVKEPAYPVLWVTGADNTVPPPFGQVIRVSSY